MRFADKLRWHRARVGLTQSAVAAAAGVSLATVRSWESGRAEPRYRAFLALCEFFGVSAAALEGDEAPTPRPARVA